MDAIDLQRLAFLEVAVNEAADGVYLIDPDRMEYVYVNEAAARLKGVDRQTLMARGLKWIIDDYGATVEQIQREYREMIAHHPASSTVERPLPQEGGTTVMIETTRRAVRIEDRWFIISVARDISERRAAQEQLKLNMDELARSNAELEQFAYIASHDLSEPLRMIASYTQLLERRYVAQLDGDAREFMGFVNDGAKRMKQLIDALLQYSRAGRKSEVNKPLALDRALDDALANLSQAISESGAVIERGPLPTLSVDKVAMMQLFQNLTSNALKFRGERSPVIRIAAHDAQPDWLFTVSDNGIGIAPQYFERIFAVFQRLHSRTDYEGTGIGLSICKKIVERHGGRIWVESQPGEGATFMFTLPKEQTAGRAA
jgi:PAS domain S-box-containing protein